MVYCFGFFLPLKSSNLQGIVIVEKTQMSEQYFSAIQKFTVLDLGMVLLPVASQMEASCLIIQLVSTDSYSSRNRSPALQTPTWHSWIFHSSCCPCYGCNPSVLSTVVLTYLWSTAVQNRWSFFKNTKPDSPLSSLIIHLGRALEFPEELLRTAICEPYLRSIKNQNVRVGPKASICVVLLILNFPFGV